MKFAEIRFPVKVARKLAIETDHRTAVHDGYVVKTFLADRLGPDVIRPWRLIEIDDGEFVVVGVVRDKASVGGSHADCSIRVVDYTPKVGDTLELEVHTTATRRVRQPAASRPGSDAEKQGWNRSQVDVASEYDEGSRRFLPVRGQAAAILYSRWIMGILNEGGTKSVDIPKIISSKPVEILRKADAGPARPVRTHRSPSIHASVRVVIEDVEAFERLLVKGVGKSVDIGMGALLPESMIEEAMS